MKSLKQLREKYEMSQESLAEALGVTAITIRRWEKEYSKMPAEVIPKLAKLFNKAETTIWKELTKDCE